MELRLYLDILRRRWPIVVALPLLVALISLAAGLARPARFGASARLLITRAAMAGGTAGLTDQGEDKTAQDLPAIVSGATFRSDLAAELARQGRASDPAALAGAIQASNQDHVVTIAVQAASPGDAVAIVQAAIDLVGRNGLQYWGDRGATAARPGLNVAVLDPPEQAARLNGPRSIALDVGLRTLLGLVAAVGAAFALHYLAPRQGYGVTR